MNAAPCSWRVRMKRISGVERSTSRIGRFIVPGMPNTWSMPSRRRQSTTACAAVVIGPAGSAAHAEQLGGVALEDRQFVRVAEPRGGHDVLDRHLGPRIGKVGPQHELAGPHLGGKVAQSFGGENHRVVIPLLPVFGRLLL